MEPIYLDNASTSFPKPPQVAQAMFDYVTGCGCNIGRGGYEGAYQAEETVLRTRQQLCRLFHGPDSRCVAFTKNITESLNVLLKGLLRPGDHVLVSAMEHNAVMRPQTQLTRRGVTFDRIPCRPDGTLMTENPAALQALYHDMLRTNAQMLGDIERSFPGTVTNGVLDRKALGATVFSNEAALVDLNAITHHYIGLEVSKKLREWAMSGGKIAAIDAIALLESGLGEKCCAVVGIVAEKTTRIERIMKRDGISYEYAMMRVNAQYPNEYFEQKCEYVLHNDGSEDKFRKECKNLFKEVLKNG